MIERVLLAVDDSPDSLAATKIAVEVVAALGARLRAVHVSADHLLDAALEAASGQPAAGTRRARSAVAVLERASALADTAGIAAETDLLAGDVGPAILDAARDWAADLIVVGKSARSASGEPYVGSQTRHVLEFADQPVLVVTPRRH